MTSKGLGEMFEGDSADMCQTQVISEFRLLPSHDGGHRDHHNNLHEHPCQTGLDLVKQLQIENFLGLYNVDILHCQEINIVEDSFKDCNYLTSSYNILTNNAQNKYGTCSFVANNFQAENVKMDTNGRVLAFDIENITFCNVYLQSGSDQTMKNGRENYAAEVIP